MTTSSSLASRAGPITSRRVSSWLTHRIDWRMACNMSSSGMPCLRALSAISTSTGYPVGCPALLARTATASTRSPGQRALRVHRTSSSSRSLPAVPCPLQPGVHFGHLDLAQQVGPIPPPRCRQKLAIAKDIGHVSPFLIRPVPVTAHSPEKTRSLPASRSTRSQVPVGSC